MAEALGATLSSARRRLGRSLAEAEAATRIRGKMLEALERGEWETLPNEAYVRGYIISYAKFLELDPAPLLQMYSEETGHQTNRERMRLPEQVVPTRDRAHHIPWRAAAAIALATGLIALIVWGIGRFAAGPEELPPVPNVPEATSSAGSPEPTGTQPAVTPTASVDATTTPQQPGSGAEGEPFKLTIDVSSEGASWLRVTVDGLKAYEGTLAGGQSKEWDVQDEAVVRVGKPSMVTVARNGQRLEIPTAAETPQMTITATDPAPVSGQ